MSQFCLDCVGPGGEPVQIGSTKTVKVPARLINRLVRRKRSAERGAGPKNKKGENRMRKNGGKGRMRKNKNGKNRMRKNRGKGGRRPQRFLTGKLSCIKNKDGSVHRILKIGRSAGTRDLTCEMKHCKLKSATVEPTCYASGDPHIHTFDKKSHHYQGTCRVSVVEPLDKTKVPTPFKVMYKATPCGRAARRVSCVKYVEVEVNNKLYRLGRNGLIRVDGIKVTAPYFFPPMPPNACNISNVRCSLSIIRQGIKGSLLNTDFGLAVSYDGVHIMRVSIPKKFGLESNTGGICGYWDGNKDNDWRLKNGTSVQDYNVFGQSWVLNDPEDPKCKSSQTPPKCTGEKRKQAERLCGMLEDRKGPFKQCFAHPGFVKQNSPDDAFEDCVFDSCAFDNDPKRRCLAMETYAKLCQAKLKSGTNISPMNPIIVWRSAQVCPSKCPFGMHYEACASPCRPSCTNRKPVCRLPCEEQCVCDDPKMVLHKNGKRCIPVRECGCLDRMGIERAAGENWLENHCKGKCTCRAGGSIRCEPTCRPPAKCVLVRGKYICRKEEIPDLACETKHCKVKPATCMQKLAPTCIALGDPHIHTFDKKVHHYQGTCRLSVVEPLDPTKVPEPFKVMYKATPCGRAARRASCVKYVEVEVNKKLYRLGRNGLIMANGLLVTAPYFDPPMPPNACKLSDVPCSLSIVKQGRKGLLLNTNFGLAVQYDGSHVMRVSIPKNFGLESNTGGICGYWDGKKDNDWRMKNGTSVEDYNVFGRSWILNDPEDPNCKISKPPPKCTVEKRKLAERQCAMLKDRKGPFKKCFEHPGLLKQISPQDVFEDCVFDSCASNNDPKIRCLAVEAFAKICQAKLNGTKIVWRSANICPSNCPVGMHYEACASPCRPTCTSRRPKCRRPCEELCVCDDPKMVLHKDGKKCISFHECGCLDKMGIERAVGENWLENRCTGNCTCHAAGSISCRPTCKPPKKCVLVRGRYECATDGHNEPSTTTTTTRKPQPQTTTATTRKPVPQTTTTTTRKPEPQTTTTTTRNPTTTTTGKPVPQTTTTTTRKPEPQTTTTTTRKPEPRTTTTTTRKPEPETTTTRKPEPQTTITTTRKPEPQTTTTTTRKPQPQTTTTTTRKPEPQTTTTTTRKPEPQTTTTTTRKPQPQTTTTTTKKPEPQTTTTTTRKPEPQTTTTTTRKPEPQTTTTTTRKPVPQTTTTTTRKPEPQTTTTTTRKPEPQTTTTTTRKPEPQSTTTTTRKPEPQTTTTTTRKPQPQTTTPTTRKPQPPQTTATTRKPEPPQKCKDYFPKCKKLAVICNGGRKDEDISSEDHGSIRRLLTRLARKLSGRGLDDLDSSEDDESYEDTRAEGRGSYSHYVASGCPCPAPHPVCPWYHAYNMCPMHMQPPCPCQMPAPPRRHFRRCKKCKVSKYKAIKLVRALCAKTCKTSCDGHEAAHLQKTVNWFVRNWLVDA